MEPKNQNDPCSIIPKLENLGLDDILTNGELTVYVATWNMNCKDPPDDLSDLIPPECKAKLPDILVFGTQECTTDKSWEIGLQRAIGPTHVPFRATKRKNSSIKLAIFINRGLVWYCSEPEVETILLSWSTRSTKGAVSISFELFGSSFLFIACHLAAHEDHLEDRLENVKEITKHFAKDYECTDLGQKFDYIFWSGDMNFRIVQPRGQVLQWISTNEYPLKQAAQNLHGEQLTESMQDGVVFRGYREYAILFPPTYKFDVGTDIYDTSQKLRTPSYTDRIIYKSRISPDRIKCEKYYHIPTFRTSDHKPVYGIYKVKVNTDNPVVSPTGGFYHRKIFMAALKEDEE